MRRQHLTMRVDIDPLPFGLLHFPTHLAVGLVPLILILGSLLSNAEEVSLQPGVWVRRLAAIAVAAMVLIGAYWQMQRMTLNLWRGGLSFALASAENLDPQNRAQQAAMPVGTVLREADDERAGTHAGRPIPTLRSHLRGGRGRSADRRADPRPVPAGGVRTDRGLAPQPECHVMNPATLRYLGFVVAFLVTVGAEDELVAHHQRVSRETFVDRRALDRTNRAPGGGTPPLRRLRSRCRC